METNATITLSSIYRGQPLFKLALSYGKLNFLAPASGMGKTALGLFLRDESFRRLGIEPRGALFVPRVDWEILIDGPLGLVEYLSTEGRKGKLVDYLNLRAPLEGLFRQKGRASCNSCGAEIIKRDSKEFVEGFAEFKQNYLLLGVELQLKPEAVLMLLEWSRAHSISRLLVAGQIRSLPKTKEEDAAFGSSLFAEGDKTLDLMLIREVIQRDALDASFSRSVGDVIGLSEIAQSALGAKATPKLHLGEVIRGAERTFVPDKQLNLSTPFICMKCGAGFATALESKVDKLTLAQIYQSKLLGLRDFFQQHFSSDWQRLFELEIGDIYLLQPIDEIPAGVLLELKLLSLILTEIRDSLIFVDSKLTEKSLLHSIELTMLGNAVVSEHEDGFSLAGFLPSEYVRPSEIIDQQKEERAFTITRNSIEPLIIEAGLEKGIVELYASLPEARRQNLTSKDLSFHAAKCKDCSGLGYLVINIASLGKIAEVCKTCFGSRYEERVLFVKYQDLNLAQLLRLSIIEAREFFLKRAEIAAQLGHLVKLGLGSYRLGDERRLWPKNGSSRI